MARTRTPGIRIDRDGRCIIDKERHGVGAYLRLVHILHAKSRAEVAQATAESRAARHAAQDHVFHANFIK